MFLAVDIGNTNINNGVFSGGRIKKTFSLPTYGLNLGAEYVKKLKPYLGKLEGGIIVSVVPKVQGGVVKALKKVLGKKVFIVGKDVKVPVKNRYRRPREVGQDRLVNALAGYDLHGGQTIIVDFGTAITIDIINKQREYLGGVITPGVETSLSGLAEKAYLLPKVNLKKPKALLGKETRESMISGAIYGFSSLCDGLVAQLKKKYCKNAHVIATGGASRLIGPYCKTVERIDTDLTLKGLAKIYGDASSTGRDLNV